MRGFTLNIILIQLGMQGARVLELPPRSIETLTIDFAHVQERRVYEILRSLAVDEFQAHESAGTLSANLIAIGALVREMSLATSDMLNIRLSVLNARANRLRLRTRPEPEDGTIFRARAIAPRELLAKLSEYTIVENEEVKELLKRMCDVPQIMPKCPICFVRGKSNSEFVLTSCAHVMCAACLQEHVAKNGQPHSVACPMCRYDLRRSGATLILRVVSAELEPRALATVAPPTDEEVHSHYDVRTNAEGLSTAVILPDAAQNEPTAVAGSLCCLSQGPCCKRGLSGMVKLSNADRAATGHTCIHRLKHDAVPPSCRCSLVPEAECAQCLQVAKEFMYLLASRCKTPQLKHVAPWLFDSDVQFGCDKCGTQPIVKARWHCQQCADYDLCEECFLSGSEFTKAHTATHTMTRFVIPETSAHTEAAKAKECAIALERSLALDLMQCIPGIKRAARNAIDKAMTTFCTQSVHAAEVCSAARHIINCAQFPEVDKDFLLSYDLVTAPNFVGTKVRCQLAGEPMHRHAACQLAWGADATAGVRRAGVHCASEAEADVQDGLLFEEPVHTACACKSPRRPQLPRDMWRQFGRGAQVGT